MGFFLIAVIAATFILGALLAPKIKTQNAKSSGLSDFNFPRSKEGDPVGIVIGTVKIKSPNTIWAGDFEARPIKKKIKTGLFSSKKVITGYQYLIGLDLCVALGPDVNFRKMWFGKDLVWTGCLSECENSITIDLPELYGGKDRNGGVGGTFTLYCGNFDQAQDSYLASKINADVSAYRGFAHVVFEKFYWGNGSQIQPVYFEVSRFSNFLGLTPGFQYMANGLDANPIEALYAIHVNQWGNLGIDPALIDIDNWREIAMTVYDENNGVSFNIAQPTDGDEIAKEIMAQINATLFQDPQSGKIKIKLIRADYDIDDLPIFGPDEIESVRNFSVILWDETINTVRIAFTNRANEYADGLAMQQEFANIRYSGKIRAALIKYPYCFDAALASELAAREMSNLSIPLFKADLLTNRKTVEIGPGDPFIMVWPEYNISQIVMRVRKIGLGKRRDGRITMGVVQDEFATAATVIALPPPSDHINENFPAADIASFLLYEIPYFLEYQATDLESRAGYYRLASMALAPNNSQIAYHANIDAAGPIDDDDTRVLDTAPFAITAQLDTDLGRWDGFASGILPVLVIKALNDPDALADGDAAAVRLGSGLFILNGEFMAYETFTDNLDGTYDLENVHRAFIDTSWIGGLANDRLWILDGQEGFFESDILPAATDFYFQSITANNTLAKADAAIHAFTPIMRKDRPLPPDFIQIDAARADNLEIDVGLAAVITWRERNRLNADQIAFEDDATTAPETGTSYRIELWRGGIERFSEDGIAQPYDLIAPLDAIGNALIKLYSVRDGLLSYMPCEIPVYVNPPAEFLLVDDDPVTIDDDYVEIA